MEALGIKFVLMVLKLYLIASKSKLLYIELSILVDGDYITYKESDNKIMNAVEETMREKRRSCVTIRELREKTGYHPRTIIEHLDLAKCHGAGEFDDAKIMFCINDGAFQKTSERAKGEK